METNREHYRAYANVREFEHWAPIRLDPSCGGAVPCWFCRHCNHYRDPRFATCGESWLAAPYGQSIDVRDSPVVPPDPPDPNPL